MSKATPTAGERRRSLIAVTASLTVLALIHGLTMPLLALVLEAQGVEKSLIGLSSATQAVAVFTIAPFMPRWIARFGLARLMIGSMLMTIAVFLLLPVFPNVYAWFPLRFLLGVSGSLLWIGGEAWVNQMVDDSARGRVVACYTAALSAGMAIGPFVLVLTGTEGWPPFLAAAALIAISGAPLLFAADVVPDVSGTSSIGLPAFLAIAPAALLLNGVYAATDMAFLTFLPIYTIDLGLGEASSLTLLTIAGVGGLVFQLPIGWLADRVDRHLLVVVTVSIVIAGAAAMPFVIAVETWNMVFMFAFGGMFASLYTLALVLLGERFRGADLASASVVFGVMWGAGSVAGPPISGATMELLEPHGLPIVIGVAFALYLPIPIWEYVKKRRRHRS